MIYWLSAADDSGWAKSPLTSRLVCLCVCECEVTARGLNSDLSVTVNAHLTDSSHLLRPEDWNSALSKQRKINIPLREEQEKVKDDQLESHVVPFVNSKGLQINAFYINFICTITDFSAHTNDTFLFSLCVYCIKKFVFDLCLVCYSVPVLFLLCSSDTEFSTHGLNKVNRFYSILLWAVWMTNNKY